LKPAFRSVLLLALAAILPICAFAVVLAVVSWRQERAAVADDALDRVRALSLLVDRELTAQLEIVKMLAQLPPAEAGDLAAIDAALRRLQQTQPLWLTALVVEPNGMIVVDTHNPVPARAVDMTSVTELVERKEALIGNVRRGTREARNLGLPIRAPVMRDGQVVYAMTVVIRPETIGTILADSGIPRAWLGGVMDRAGQVVARSRGPTDLLGGRASDASIAAVARGGEGFYQGRSLEGIDVVTAYHVSPATGWSVHIGIPVEIYEAPIRRWMWLLVGGAAGALLMGGLLASLVAREMSARREEAVLRERGRRMESLGRLTGGIAHDFNNLLTAILGGVQMLRRRNATPETVAYIDAIERAAERGAEITRDMLMFVRGGGEQLQPIDVNERIRASLGILRQSLGAGILVDLDLAPELPAVTANPIQFDLALLNIGSNASDAMDGRGILHIATRLSKEADAQVEIVVTDTGRGIREEDLPYVFEPFFTTKAAAHGAGLGLAQVYGFTRQSGGTAEIASQRGQGTTVTMRLPAAQVPTEARGNATSDERSTKTGIRAQTLLVDDNADVRATIAEYLRDVGFEVEEAQDAADALTRFGGRRFDVVVSDIIMPGRMNGIALAQELRRRQPDLPVILISGYSESTSDAIAEGWTVLAKPYSFDRLEAAIDAALRTKVSS
jgi:signal transduction histidine kinase/CheY-like chemotaxis protein